MASFRDVPTFRAFRSLNYTLYFTGRSFSQFGTWMQRTAVVWVIYTLTQSPFMLGVTLFAEQFPAFLLFIFGGIAADRYDRFRIIKITQIASMVQASLLAVLILMDHYVVWEILALSVLLGIINAFDIPARQSMIHEVLYDQADLPNALALNSAMASVARLLGPAISGLILESWGAGICFLINALSFGAVILSLAFMKLPTFVPPVQNKNVRLELLEGFRYVKQTPAIGLIILTVGLIGLLVRPYNTLLPVFAKVIFSGDAATYGYITGFIGLGAVAGTVYLASMKREVNLKKILLIGILVLSVGLLAFSVSSIFPLAMVFAVIVGFGTVAQTTLGNIIVQSGSAPQMRGRVISLLLMAMFGMVPLGSLLIGAISQQIGAPAALFCQGMAGLGIALLFAYFLKNALADRKQPSPRKETVAKSTSKILTS